MNNSCTHLNIINDPFPKLGQCSSEGGIIGDVLDLNIGPSICHPTSATDRPIQDFEAFYLSVAMFERDVRPLDYDGCGGCGVGCDVAGAQGWYCGNEEGHK